jgi:hypothetical protein
MNELFRNPTIRLLSCAFVCVFIVRFVEGESISWLALAISGVYLLGVGIVIRRRPALSSIPGHVSVDSLAENAAGVASVPFLLRLLPDTAAGCQRLGALILMLPILSVGVLFVADTSASQTVLNLTKQVGLVYTVSRSDFAPDVDMLNGCLLLFLFILLYQYFRIGAAIYLLPMSLQQTKWDFGEWLEVTRLEKSPIWMTFSKLCEQRAKLGNAAIVAVGCVIALAYLAQVMAVVLAVVILLHVAESGTSASGLQLLFVPGFLLLGLSKLARRHLNRKSLAVTNPTEACSPVLYLRAFNDDHFLSSKVGMFGETFEESILQQLTLSKRRVVALGRPGERLPPLGAERYYVSDEDWQATISDWIETSCGIVMIAARTEATGWEMSEIYRKAAMNKFLLLIPPQFDVFHFFPPSWSEATGVEIRRWKPLREGRARHLLNLLKARLSDAGIRNLDGAFEVPELLVGVRFTTDNEILVITAKARTIYALKEAVKLHFWKNLRIAASVSKGAKS